MDVERAEIIVSELVTNAIRHGSGPDGLVAMELEVSVETSSAAGAMSGRVSDHGPVFAPGQTAPLVDQIGGFGLHIVDRLADTWSIERTPVGNVVTFSV
jgi:anti-sigma regulatory factor (Ser/Thr protein kinase)